MWAGGLRWARPRHWIRMTGGEWRQISSLAVTTWLVDLIEVNSGQFNWKIYIFYDGILLFILSINCLIVWFVKNENCEEMLSPLQSRNHDNKFIKMTDLPSIIMCFSTLNKQITVVEWNISLLLSAPRDQNSRHISACVENYRYTNLSVTRRQTVTSALPLQHPSLVCLMSSSGNSRSLLVCDWVWSCVW